MSEAPQETLVERTLSNLTTAWRDISQSAARTVGIARAPVSAKPESLTRLMRDCLEARGGEVSARMRAAALGRTYLEMDAKGREGFPDSRMESPKISPMRLTDQERRNSP